VTGPAGPACRATRKDGASCRAASLPGSAFCWAHDPSQAEAARAARARGAANASKARALKRREPALDDIPGLVQFTGLVVRGVLAQRIPEGVGRAALYGCSILRALLETADVAARLEKVEQLLQELDIDEAARPVRWGRR
jgi:hypothetical protein